MNIRDDGLAVISASGPQIDGKLKQLIDILKKEGISNTTVINVTTVDFLNIQFDLCKHKFKPFHKPDGKTGYVSSDSNHPPLMLKNIPPYVNNRLKNISSSTDIF